MAEEPATLTGNASLKNVRDSDGDSSDDNNETNKYDRVRTDKWRETIFTGTNENL